MKIHFFEFILVIFCSFNTKAQNLPDTDIYLFDLKEKKGKISLGKAKNITNHKGYDNQPFFHGVDYLLYTEEQKGQTDIVILDLVSEKKTNLTNSKESEYSPEMVPGFDSFSAIRVEEDQTQRLWLFHLNKKKDPQLVFEDLAPVGYQAWNGTDVATFILGDPITLVLTNAKNRHDRKITDHIGRTLRALPGTPDFVFEKTNEEGETSIYKLETSSGDFEKIIAKPKNASDWTITKEGTFITSVGTKIMSFNPNQNNAWQEVVELSELGSKGITRMAVNEDNSMLAMVINQ